MIKICLDCDYKKELTELKKLIEIMHSDIFHWRDAAVDIIKENLSDAEKEAALGCGLSHEQWAFNKVSARSMENLAQKDKS
jgi:hypothetical protein